jgi:hypothetical protein
VRPREIATEDGVTLGHYEDNDLVSLKIEGKTGEVIFGVNNWRKLVQAWNDYDKQSREAAIDRRIYKDRPDGW